MKRKILLSLSAFVVVLILHASYVVVQGKKLAERWAVTNYLQLYVERSEYLIGASYAFAIGFSVFALLRFLESRTNGFAGLARQTSVGLVGAITLTGVLYVAGCFLLGCCGSPMVAVYLTLFGSSFLGFAKPLTFGLTLASIVVGYVWMERKSVAEADCCEGEEECPPASGRQADIETKPLEKIEAELREGMALAKCRKCGCMKETLETLENALGNPSLRDKSVEPRSAPPQAPASRRSGWDQPLAENGLEGNIANWQTEMEPIKYACLGCEYCFPAVAMNLFNEAYPEAAPNDALSCAFEVPARRSVSEGGKESASGGWPPVAGEYTVLCEVGDPARGNGDCPVAISTLGSPDLADNLAALRPEGVCIVGKTENENIGIDKIIKNTITNRAIRFLVLAGCDPVGHLPGQTLLCLSANGVDEKMRIIGSKGKRPILRNVTANEVESFRKQVQVIDMIGCEDTETIVEQIKELPMNTEKNCGCAECNDENAVAEVNDVPVVQAQEPSKIQMDKAGYFVVLPQAHKGTILVEHYGYNDKLLQTIEGKDSRSLYWTIIENNWVTQLSHSAYLGKELAKAELSIKHGFKYVQDGA